MPNCCHIYIARKQTVPNIASILTRNTRRREKTKANIEIGKIKHVSCHWVGRLLFFVASIGRYMHIAHTLTWWQGKCIVDKIPIPKNCEERERENNERAFWIGTSELVDYVRTPVLKYNRSTAIGQKRNLCTIQFAIHILDYLCDTCNNLLVTSFSNVHGRLQAFAKINVCIPVVMSVPNRWVMTHVSDFFLRHIHYCNQITADQTRAHTLWLETIYIFVPF